MLSETYRRDHFVWAPSPEDVPECGFEVHVTRSVIAQVVDWLDKLYYDPRGYRGDAPEVFALLFGRAVNSSFGTVVHADAWAQVELERSGPTYGVLSADRAHATLVAACPPGRDIVGWLHTHPDAPLLLSDQDVELHRARCPEGVAWVVDPASMEGAFFGPDRQGRLDGEERDGRVFSMLQECPEAREAPRLRRYGRKARRRQVASDRVAGAWVVDPRTPPPTSETVPATPHGQMGVSPIPEQAFEDDVETLALESMPTVKLMRGLAVLRRYAILPSLALLGLLWLQTRPAVDGPREDPRRASLSPPASEPAPAVPASALARAEPRDRGSRRARSSRKPPARGRRQRSTEARGVAPKPAVENAEVQTPTVEARGPTADTAPAMGPTVGVPGASRGKKSPKPAPKARTARAAARPPRAPKSPKRGTGAPSGLQGDIVQVRPGVYEVRVRVVDAAGKNRGRPEDWGVVIYRNGSTIGTLPAAEQEQSSGDFAAWALDACQVQLVMEGGEELRGHRAKRTTRIDLRKTPKLQDVKKRCKAAQPTEELASVPGAPTATVASSRSSPRHHERIMTRP